jgi:hypothetical protein
LEDLGTSQGDIFAWLAVKNRFWTANRLGKMGGKILGFSALLEGNGVQESPFCQLPLHRSSLGACQGFSWASLHWPTTLANNLNSSMVANYD